MKGKALRAHLAWFKEECSFWAMKLSSKQLSGVTRRGEEELRGKLLSIEITQQGGTQILYIH